MQVTLADSEGLRIQTEITTGKRSYIQEGSPVIAEADAGHELETEGSDHKHGPHHDHGSGQLCSPTLFLKTSE